MICDSERQNAQQRRRVVLNPNQTPNSNVESVKRVVSSMFETRTFGNGNGSNGRIVSNQIEQGNSNKTTLSEWKKELEKGKVKAEIEK